MSMIAARQMQGACYLTTGAAVGVAAAAKRVASNAACSPLLLNLTGGNCASDAMSASDGRRA